MNKEKLQSLNKWLIVFLVVLQPIVDIIRKTIVHDIQFLGFSMFEMLNLIIIILSLIISIYLYKDKKYFKRFLIIIPVFLIYAIFHYINMLKLNTSVYENLNISFLVETYYLFRVFMIPLLLIISMLYSDIKKDTYIRVVEIMALIISSVIVISNIFLFGYPAYDVDNYVHNNIFGWFFFNSKSYYDYYNITSRGLFNSGNQIASVLFMISPIIIYQAYKKRSIFNYALLVLTSISMLMVGTKIANVGIILVFLTFIVIFFFFKLLDKKSYSIKPILYIFIFIAFLFCFSPVSHNLRYIMKGGKSLSKVEVLGQNKNPSNQNISEDNKQEYENFIEIQKYDCNNLTDIQIKKIINFYKKSSSFIGLSSFITENYNVDKHTKFWCDYIKNYNGSDYRELKTSIYENIKRENNNWFDNLFGLGHTLNFIYTEEDYTYQLYSYGLIGFIVLLGPYFIFILFMFFKILKNYKKKFNIESVVYLMSPIIAMCAAYFSGYMFETTMTLITLALIIVLNLISLQENRTLSKKVLFIASTGGHLSELLQLNKIYNDYEYRLITEKTESTVGLRNKYGKKIKFLVFGSKDHRMSYIFKFSYNCIKSLFIYLTFNPNVIVTTGTHTAVPMCYIGKFFGSKIIFIETFANSKTKTLSGKLVYPIADEFIVQWESMLELYPNAIYNGWIY